MFSNRCQYCLYICHNGKIDGASSHKQLHIWLVQQLAHHLLQLQQIEYTQPCNRGRTRRQNSHKGQIWWFHQSDNVGHRLFALFSLLITQWRQKGELMLCSYRKVFEKSLKIHPTVCTQNELTLVLPFLIHYHITVVEVATSFCNNCFTISNCTLYVSKLRLKKGPEKIQVTCVAPIVA